MNEAIIKNLREAVQRIQSSAGESSEIKEELSASTIETSSALNQITANIASIREGTDHLDGTIEANTGAVNAKNGEIRRVDERISEQTSMVEESRAAIQEMTSFLSQMSQLTTAQRDATAALSEESRRAADQLGEAQRTLSVLPRKPPTPSNRSRSRLVT